MCDLLAGSDVGVQPVTLFAAPLPDRTILLVFQEAGNLAQPELDQDSDELRMHECRANLLEEQLRLTQTGLHSAVQEMKRRMRS
ncbi:hypothetical protein [Paracoccus sp. (in: a-proteobacteria)]|uniref:hypothetical protein n=1 Tax=Paracoccus sp. TaxID=267 RepID=UPI00396C4177